MHGCVSLRKPLWTIIKSIGLRPTPPPSAFLAHRSLFRPSQPRCQQSPRVISEDEFLASFDNQVKPVRPKKQPRPKKVAASAAKSPKGEGKQDRHAAQPRPEEPTSEVVEDLQKVKKTASEIPEHQQEETENPSQVAESQQGEKANPSQVTESHQEHKGASLEPLRPGSPSKDVLPSLQRNTQETKPPEILQRIPPVVRKGLSNATFDNLGTVCFEDGRPNGKFATLARKEIAQREQHELARRQERTRMHPDSPVTLADVKHLLLRMSPKDPGVYEQQNRVARIPQGHTAFFNDDPLKALLTVSLHTSCEVQINNKSDGQFGFVQFGLRGTNFQIESALAIIGSLAYMIKRDEPDTRLDFHADLLPVQKDKDTVIFPNLIRSVWWSHGSPTALRSVFLDSRSSSWTIVSFAKYVSDLTARRSYNELREATAMATASATFDKIAHELKWQLINGATIGSYLSSEAVTKAFTWYCQHSEYLPVLRQVVNALERSATYTMTASNYEVMLDTMAREDDVHNFHYLLKSMATRELQPTWRAHAYMYYLACLRDPTMAANLMKQMIALGVLANVDAVRHTAASTAYMLARHFQGKTLTKSLDRILERFDTLFEPRRLGRSPRHTRPRDWLSPENANRLADVFLLQGRTHDAFRVIEMLLNSGKGQKADRTTANVFLRSAYALKEPPRAIAILSLLKIGLPGAKGKLDQNCWTLLWRIARRLKMYNMMRVIWRYACMYGQADWEFRKLIARELSLCVVSPSQIAVLRGGEDGGRVPKDADRMLPALAIWRGWTAKFVVGVANGLKVSDTLSAFEEEMVLAASDLSATDTQASERERRHGETLRADLDQAGLLMPVRPLYQALEEAYERDVAWGLPFPYRVIDVSNLTWADFKDLTPEQRQSKMADALKKAFRGMMEDGVKVEVRVGDARRPWERTHLADDSPAASRIHTYRPYNISKDDL